MMIWSCEDNKSLLWLQVSICILTCVILDLYIVQYRLWHDPYLLSVCQLVAFLLWSKHMQSRICASILRIVVLDELCKRWSELCFFDSAHKNRYIEVLVYSAYLRITNLSRIYCRCFSYISKIDGQRIFVTTASFFWKGLNILKPTLLTWMWRSSPRSNA